MDPNIANIVEDNVLESGEHAVGINTDATDNLEVGIPAVMIETVANDNAVVEGYSKELNFRNQPQLQYQPKTNYQVLIERANTILREEYVESEVLNELMDAFTEEHRISHELYVDSVFGQDLGARKTYQELYNSSL